MKPGDVVKNVWTNNEYTIDSINKQDSVAVMTDGSSHMLNQLELSSTISLEEAIELPPMKDLKADRLSLFKDNVSKAVKELEKDGKAKTEMLRIPQKALRAVGNAMTEPKYDRYNHSKPMSNVLLVEAALRHINDWACGIDNDESGNHHLTHAVANLMMALDQHLNGTAIEGRDPAYLTNGN